MPNSSSRDDVEKGVKKVFTAGLILLLATGAISLWSAAQSVNTFRRVDHTHNVLAALENIHVAILNVETAARGFVIAGEDNLLEPYSIGVTQARAALAEVKQLTVDNPLQQARVQSLHAKIEASLGLAANRIDARRRPDFNLKSQYQAQETAKQSMDEIRRQILEMEQGESGLLAKRTRKAQGLARSTIGVVLLGSCIAIAFVSFSGFRVHRDFLKRKEAENEIEKLNETLRKRAADLELANHELESFSYSVSHDLRAPLRHTAGFVNLLTANSRPTLDEKAQRYLNIIADSTRQMGCLIDDLLNFSRMGRSEMQQAPVNLDLLVGQVIDELMKDISGRKITWKRSHLPQIQGDAAMLRQVWINLLSNALKYTREKEEAAIEIGFCAEPAGACTFLIRDNGIGFDMRYSDKLFGVFQRLHRSEDFEGTGIGLANVRRIIQRHGGRTWAEGKINEGATFYFTLPQAQSDGPLLVDNLRASLGHETML